ncbi:sulfurtransferase [Acidaminobacter sp. JC074]|uniref:sulfurtransferase n=1 Tax=Acidaminobacter sp. JC074 TaxID=2530199 RepID=UPI001F10215B|nr:sulfurtransferase [Acidaminobacter sp. JC074]MCH4887641.1 sulfurtransferase [Acidaminobacter sp. JC074]
MYLIKEDFLKQHPDAVVIDCRYDMTNPPYGEKVYLEGHVKGAFYVDLDKDMTSEVKEHGGRHPLKDLEVFTELMGSFGITSDSTIVIYDNGELAMASRLWFMLKLIGLNSFIVEGGYDHLKDHFEMTNEVPEKVPSSLKIHYNPNLICNKDDVIMSMTNPKSVIVDSRSNERYLGFEEPFDKIAGHIPTAVNYFWKDNFDGLNAKDCGDIEAMFLEMDNYEERIIHCGSGITGCVNMFFLNEIGIESKLYAGSYSDWVSYDDHDVIVKDNIKRKVKA